MTIRTQKCQDQQPPDTGTVPAGNSGFATVDETAQFLNLSRSMVHKLIGEGEIPAKRYGRAVRISWLWLRSQLGE
jgi:excisionase family DNA binding protein